MQRSEVWGAYEGVEFSEDLDELKSKLKGTAFDEPVWEAVFEIYQAQIQVPFLSDGLALSTLRQNLKWVAENKRAVGCGETWPIDCRGKDNYRSQSNRRVEILFYDPYELKKYTPGKDTGDEEKPFLPCKDGTCDKGDCHIFKDIDREKGDHETYEPKLVWKYIPLDKDGNIDGIFIRLALLPSAAKVLDYKFTLFSNDEPCSYSQTKTLKDDLITGDQFVDLFFSKIDKNLLYSLRVDPGSDGSPYMVVSNYPYEYWIKYQ